jgi:hypothetical protein
VFEAVAVPLYTSTAVSLTTKIPWNTYTIGDCGVEHNSALRILSQVEGGIAVCGGVARRAVRGAGKATPRGQRGGQAVPMVGQTEG